MGSALRAMARPCRRSSRHPATAQAPAGRSPRVTRPAPTETRKSKLPLVGSPSARSMTRLRPAAARQPLRRSRSLAYDRREGQPDRQGRIADRLDEGHGFGCQPRRLAAAGVEQVLHHQPRHADGQRRLVPGGGAQLPQFVEAVTGHVAIWTRKAVPHNMVRGAMRMAARSGSSAGNASATWRARSQLSTRRGDVAVGRPRSGAHVPAVRGVQITGGLQVLGDQRGVFVDRCRVTAVRSRPPPAGAARRDPT